MGTPSWDLDRRVGGLRRFAFAITALTVLGHTWLGFEQAWIHPLAALATGYAVELALEWIGAKSLGRPPAFSGGFRRFVDFLLPAHITALAIAMLLYPNARVMPVVFATAVALGSKSIFRVGAGGRTRHFLNPSNFGIAVTLLLFPWVGIAPPYQFTEALGPVGDWALPALIVVSGSFLNARYTGRVPLLAGWVVGFVLQALLRHVVFDTALTGALMPVTGMTFLLFTFYMVTDPATTPSGRRAQVAFGLGVALAYGVLMVLHVVFGLFFALAAVCVVRGVALEVHALQEARTAVPVEPNAGAQPALER